MRNSDLVVALSHNEIKPECSTHNTYAQNEEKVFQKSLILYNIEFTSAQHSSLPWHNILEFTSMSHSRVYPDVTFYNLPWCSILQHLCLEEWIPVVCRKRGRSGNGVCMFCTKTHCTCNKQIIRIHNSPCVQHYAADTLNLVLEI